MKQWRIVRITFLLILCFAAGALLWWRHDAPRREALAAVTSLNDALHGTDPDALLNAVVLPAAIQGRTSAEQVEFLVKALRDEISPEGVAALRRRGTYGPLPTIFPGEADRWASLAGAKPQDCVAFKMERNGVRAEVVLIHEAQGFRIVRCNNVKQMAASDS
jgi:hypothetical protein